MSRAEFDVRLNADGTGTVLVGGVQVEGLLAIRVEGIRDQAPVVTLQATAGSVEIAGVGVIQAAGADADEAAHLEEILASIDPDILDREILEGLGLGDADGPLGAKYLEAIRRYVRGD